jgi:hypothetical protein
VLFPLPETAGGPRLLNGAHEKTPVLTAGTGAILALPDAANGAPGPPGASGNL